MEIFGFARSVNSEKNIIKIEEKLINIAEHAKNLYCSVTTKHGLKKKKILMTRSLSDVYLISMKRNCQNKFGR